MNCSPVNQYRLQGFRFALQRAKWVLVALFGLIFSPTVDADEQIYRNEPSLDRVLEQLRENERRNNQLESALRGDEASDQSAICGAGWSVDTNVGNVTPTSASCDDCDGGGQSEDWFSPRFYVDYDDGFVIRPIDEQKTPFELVINGRMQFRHVGFGRNIKFFSNRGDAFRGGPLPVFNRNDFDMERVRLTFSGFVLDPNLEFFLNLDGDTDDNHVMVVHDFWVNYKFNDLFNFHVGKGKVPGTRDWLESSTVLMLADRSMATTFFRPDRSVGAWLLGDWNDDLHYHLMLADGFNTADLLFSDLDTQFAYSGSTWWDAIGDYGEGYSDLEWHDEPAVRIGHSFTYSGQRGITVAGEARAEQNFVRLSDGTRVVTPGALAPGVTVIGGKLYLYAIDLAAKYRGFSFNSEVYFRWLGDFRTIGGSVPHSNLYTDGFYVDAGYMMIEKCLEFTGRISRVDGLFGDHWEYAAGLNWYINGTHNNKVTFDVSVLDGSPAQSSSPNLRIGQDGILTRLQWQVAF